MARIREAVGREGVGAVIEMSGAAPAIEQGLGAIRCAGRFVQVGTPGSRVSLDLVGPIMHQEIQILGVFGRRMWNTWFYSEDLLMRGKVRTDLVKGGDYALADFQDAFDEALSGEAGRTFFTPHAA